jgi:hypothetical protein
MDHSLSTLFDSPKIVAIVSDVNAGKSNTLYHILNDLSQTSDFSLYHFGLRANLEMGQPIYSTNELELIKNSLIVLDEVMTMWDLDNRKQKKAIETSLRLIHHNNNILLLSMIPENIKKFIASKINAYIFKKCTIPDFINGSVAKRIVESYSGPERGAVILNVPIDKAIVYDGKHFAKVNIPYLEKYDTKKGNAEIFRSK